jgi:hypothetical protein
MRRLRTLIDHGHASLSDAQLALALVRDLISDLQDGIKVKLVRSGDGTVVDFLVGRIDELPLQIVVDPREEV